MSQPSIIMVPHNRLTFGEEEEQAVAEVIRSGHWVGGAHRKALEQALARQAGVAHAVGIASGLGAIRLALIGLGVGQGDEVIIPAYSCVALANAVLSLGAVPRPSDIRKGDWNLDPEAVGRTVSTKTKAIIAIHMFGVPAPIEDLRTFQIPILEDCAHAFGMQTPLGALGSLGDCAVLSFFATKLMASGEGGAVLTQRSSVADTVRSSRDYTNQLPSALRLNDKMTDLEAALVLSQLQRLSGMIRMRSQLAKRYHEALQPVSERTSAFLLPPFTDDRIWYRYVLDVSAEADTMIEKLAAQGVHAAKPVWEWLRDGARERCPIACRAYRHHVSIPLYPTLSDREQERVLAALARL